MRAHAWRMRPCFHDLFPLEISVVHARIRTMYRPRTWQMFHFTYSRMRFPCCFPTIRDSTIPIRFHVPTNWPSANPLIPIQFIIIPRMTIYLQRVVTLIRFVFLLSSINTNEISQCYQTSLLWDLRYLSNTCIFRCIRRSFE